MYQKINDPERQKVDELVNDLMENHLIPVMNARKVKELTVTTSVFLNFLTSTPLLTDQRVLNRLKMAGFLVRKKSLKRFVINWDV